MKIIELTRGQATTVDDEDADLVALKWYACKSSGGKTFYACRGTRKPDGTWTVQLLHRVIAARMGFSPAVNVDHKDRNGLNNRRYNLRPDPDRLNTANIGLLSTNTSGFKGVSWIKRKARWRASISVKDRTRHLGYFDDKIGAAMAYDRAALEYFGEFAFLNFPAAKVAAWTTQLSRN